MRRFFLNLYTIEILCPSSLKRGTVSAQIITHKFILVWKIIVAFYFIKTIIR